MLTPDILPDSIDSESRSVCVFEAGTTMVSRVAQLHVQILSVALAAGAVGGTEASLPCKNTSQDVLMVLQTQLRSMQAW